MKPQSGTSNAQERLASLFSVIEDGLHERGLVLRLCILAAIASESVFLLGPPGVAKSLVARRLQNAFADASCFDYLMGRFSTPEEIFGPVSINRLKNEDVYVRRTERYLPEADIVFLDEIWKASPPIQNALLTALNEKIFRNGTEEVHLPLKLLVGASNEVAHDDSTQAFWDRFLVRIEIGPLQSDDAFVSLLTDQHDPYRDVVKPELKIDRIMWQDLQSALASVELGPTALKIFLELRQKIGDGYSSESGPYVSDRRWKKCATLVRASALCHNRTIVEPIDCLVLFYCLWNKPEEIAEMQKLVEESVAANASDVAEVEAGFRSRLEHLRSLLRAHDTPGMPHTEEVPLISDDEYYVLQGFVPGDDAHLEARIWRTDFESLPLPPQEAISTDIFVYRQGIFQHSTEHLCSRGKEWTVLVDGTSIGLKTETVQRVLSELKTLSDTEWENWDSQAALFMADCGSEADRVHQELTSLRAHGSQHFFVPASAFELLSQKLKLWLTVLAQLQSEIRACQENHGCG